MNENISSINTNLWLQGQLNKPTNKENPSEDANFKEPSVKKTEADLQTFQNTLNDLNITDEEYFKFVETAQNSPNIDEKTKATTKNINTQLNSVQDSWQGKQIISEALSGLDETQKANVINQYQEEYGENLVEILEYWD